MGRAAKRQVIDSLGRRQTVLVKYKYADLKVMESFLVKNPKKFASLRAALSKYARKSGRVFYTTKIEQGNKTWLRVTRHS